MVRSYQLKRIQIYIYMTQNATQVTEIEELTELNTTPEHLSSESAGSEDSSSSEDNEIDYNSAEIHEEVECLLSGDQIEILQLIATDPEYYLGIVQNYNRTRDGREIYLSDLFNIIITRSGGSLSIKFKLSDNTQWYDVGFSGGEFDDEAVYKAFSEKVEMLVKNPPPSRREFLNSTMQPEVKEAPPMVSQGNQYKLSKIDRFLGRTDHDGPTNIEIRKSEFVEHPDIRSQSDVKPSPQKEVASDAMIDNVVKSYKEQLKARLRDLPNSNSTVVNGRFPQLSQCPETKRGDYSKLLSLINNNSPFVKDLIDSLVTSTTGQRLLITDFLYGFESSSSEEELICKLKLSDIDRQLLQTYNIRLSEL